MTNIIVSGFLSDKIKLYRVATIYFVDKIS